MFCYSNKQPIAIRLAQSAEMSTQTITETLAANLAYFMKQKGMVQAKLAAASGLGQTTISLYLNPDKRKDTSKGAAPSPTLAKVDALAQALGIELWELLRPLTPAQRDLIRSVDAVIAQHVPTPTEQGGSAPQALPTKTRVRRTAPHTDKRRRA